MLDHVDLYLSFLPKFSIAYAVGFLKAKSAVRLNREFRADIQPSEIVILKARVPEILVILNLGYLAIT